ncbi:MAG: ABC transporter substrate-binding protein [Cellulosilyticaceae bacterium]
MSRGKWLAGFVLLTLTTGAFVGCGNQSTAQANNAEATQTTTRTVVDQLGREVTIEGPVERIVSSYYITSSLLIALEAEDKVVGIEMKADTREIYKRAAPEFLELEAIGSGKALNVESILALNPDLVIIPYRLESFIPQLEALGIPTIAVEPETMEGFMTCVSLVGEAIGHEKEAKALLTYYEEQMNRVTKLTEQVEEKPSVYLSGSGTALTTVTGKMYQNDMIAIAGGENVSAELEDGYWAQISPEQLLAWNPEKWFAVSYADYTLDDILNDSKFSTIQAVQNGEVVTFPSKLEPWDYPTPSSVLGVLWLTQELHPDLYSEEEYSEDATAFYKQFFDIEVTAEDMGL